MTFIKSIFIIIINSNIPIIIYNSDVCIFPYSLNTSIRMLGFKDILAEKRRLLLLLRLLIRRIRGRRRWSGWSRWRRDRHRCGGIACCSIGRDFTLLLLLLNFRLEYIYSVLDTAWFLMMMVMMSAIVMETRRRCLDHVRSGAASETSPRCAAIQSHVTSWWRWRRRRWRSRVWFTAATLALIIIIWSRLWVRVWARRRRAVVGYFVD